MAAEGITSFNPLPYPYRFKFNHQSTSTSESSRLVGRIYNIYLQRVECADVPQRPDLQQLAKNMLRLISLEDRESVSGVGTLNLDSIHALLSEVLYLFFYYCTFKR